MVLIFFATLDQAELGIHQVQALYFKGFIAIWNYPDRWYFGQLLSWLALPIPGGYLLGPLLIANLICAHIRYFRWRWRHAGLLLLHAGLLLLLISQAISDHAQREFLIGLSPGVPTDRAVSPQRDELVIVDSRNPDRPRELHFPSQQLRNGAVLSHSELPFALRVLEFHVNSTLLPLDSPASAFPPGEASATHGVGRKLRVVPKPTRGPDVTHGERMLASARIELLGDGEHIGVWLVNSAFEGQIPPQALPDSLSAFALELRMERHTLPFSLALERKELTHFPGTEILQSRIFRVRVRNTDSGETFTATLTPNQPLRHAGYSLYQGASIAGPETLLQVVRNPAWRLPYLSILLVIVGLSLQLGLHLSAFLNQRFAR